jgi:hypothetical protein
MVGAHQEEVERAAEKWGHCRKRQGDTAEEGGGIAGRCRRAQQEWREAQQEGVGRHSREPGRQQKDVGGHSRKR